MRSKPWALEPAEEGALSSISSSGMAKCSARRYGLGLACFAVAVAMAGATQFTVGGSNGWSVPPAGAESLNAWAMKNRFQVGDKLVFVYPSDQDSVLLVEPSDYNACNCNTSSYVKKFTDGDTTFTLDHSGAFFFISGFEANCRANEKLIVMVLAAGRNGTGGAPAPSTTPPTSSPPPAPSTSPPPAQTTAPPPASPNAPPPPPSPAPTPPTTPASPPPAAPAPTTPTTTPPPASSSSPPAATPPSTPPSEPAGAPPPSSASPPGPGTHGNGTTTSTKPHSTDSNHRNGAGLTVSPGLVGSVGACIAGFAMLAL